MFKFNFAINNEEATSDSAENIDAMECTEDILWHDSKEIVPNIDEISNLITNLKTAEIIVLGDNEIAYLNPLYVLNKCSSEIVRAETNHSDLIKGEYEGGLKVWECTEDLGKFLAKPFENQDICFVENLNNKLVLDLGCGAGILGILALKHGAIVHFQDYNEDVLKNFTIPNSLLNFEDNINEVLEKAKYFSGDWNSYDELDSNKFDYIFTSETIYNPNNYQKFLNVLKNKLKSNGTVFLAAKTYYFGVGGGIRQFEDLVKKDHTLTSNTVWKCCEGVQREILKLTF